MRTLAVTAAAVVALLAPGSTNAAVKFTRFSAPGAGPIPSFGMARTGDGVLHLVYQTTAPNSSSPNGLAARAISPSGKVGPEVQALAGWSAGRPGLIALPNGSLQAFFGAIAPDNTSAVWAISSTDGGSTWSPPANVKAPDNEALAYGADVTAQQTGGNPVLTLPQAGNLVIQQGLGGTATTAVVTGSGDGSAGDVNSAVDAASGNVVAAWQSLDGSGGDFIQTVAPTPGAAQKMPGTLMNQLVIAGRDKGPGVYAGYTTDGTHVRLQRYGGGSVAVGKVQGVNAKVLGVATGLDGRIWALWGDDTTVAFTRSNKAVTKFEPIQKAKIGAATLARLSGDGRLGPLDLLVDQLPPSGPGGAFHARVLPILSGSFKVAGHKLLAKITDAGDPVKGAKVAVAGKSAKTNSSGKATIALPKSASGKLAVTVTAPGYNPLHATVKA